MFGLLYSMLNTLSPYYYNVYNMFVNYILYNPRIFTEKLISNV